MTESRAELIFHPVRMRILQALLRGGRRTAGELGARLEDVPPATLYRQLSRLVEGGAIRVVEERPVRGVFERVYEVELESGASVAGDEARGASREDHLRWFTVFLAGVLGEYERYLGGRRVDLAADGAGYRQFPLHLSDEELEEFLASMNALIGAAMRNEPRPDRRRRLLTRILIPTDETEAE